MNNQSAQHELAAIVLCGGRSRRMGFDKFMLPIGDRTFLESVVEALLTSVDGPVIAAASAGTIESVRGILRQRSTDRVHIVKDVRDDSGPMEGIRVGLDAAREFSKWAFVTSCDVPLICSKVPSLLISSIAKINDPKIEAAVPISEDRIYGMTAIYRCDAVEKVSAMIQRNQLRVSDLAAELNTIKIRLSDVRDQDPNLDSMNNLNSAADYLQFLQSHGFRCPPEIETQLLTNESNTAHDD